MSDILKDLQESKNCFSIASKELRKAWWLISGIDELSNTKAQVADTILDLEKAVVILDDFNTARKDSTRDNDNIPICHNSPMSYSSNNWTCEGCGWSISDKPLHNGEA